MVFFLLALVGTAAAGYANPPNIAPAYSAYGSSYPTPYNNYPTPGYNIPSAYTSAPVIAPFSINPMFSGAGAYNSGYQTAPMGGYNVPPPPPIPGYGVAPNYPTPFKNSYQTGYNSYNQGGYNNVPYNNGPLNPNGPIFPTGGPVLPTGGPILPNGGQISSSDLVRTLTGNESPALNPAGVLPAFSGDPWASIGTPMLRGAPTKQLNNSTIIDEIEESKKRARRG